MEGILKQIDKFVRIVHYVHILEKAPDGYITSSKVTLKDTSSIPKFLSKLSKFFP